MGNVGGKKRENGTQGRQEKMGSDWEHTRENGKQRVNRRGNGKLRGEIEKMESVGGEGKWDTREEVTDKMGNDGINRRDKRKE